MTTTTRTWTAAAAAAALSLTLAACSADEPETTEAGDTTTASAPAPVADAGDATATTAPGDGDAATATGAPAAAEGEEIPVEELMARMQSPGEDQMRTMDMSMTMELDGEQVTMEGVADFRGEDPAMDLTMVVPGAGELRLLMVEGSTYMQMPGLTQEGQFIEMSPEDIGMSAEDLTGQIDMTQQWAAWEEGAQRVVFLGSEDVGGEPMDHYRLDVDSAAAMEASGETAVPGMPETITYDVWLDEQDLMRKVAFDAGGATTEVLVDNWGEDVTIEAPEESDVVQAPVPTGG